MADSRDILGKNRKFTGTSGIKLPVGNTSQRDTNVGQGAIRFNSETATAEYYDGTNWQTISAPPNITSCSPGNVLSADGSTTSFTISGSNFTTAGATASFIGSDGTTVNATSTTVNSATQITAVATSSDFANSKEPYKVKIENNSGLSAELASAITVDNRPAWSTSAGSLGTVTDSATGTHFTLSATDPEGDTVTYAVTTGSLPGGMSLNSSTGAISGDPTNVGSSTTTTFTVTATSTGDVTLTAARQFSITVIPAPTGGTITSYSTYTVHTFTSPGTFTTLGNLTADILIVGGGGGGGSHHAGGGGSGGMIELPANTVPANPYSITIGAGAGSFGDGNDTTAFGQTAKGGGRGGNYTGPPANSGGSGGGGSGGSAGSGASSNQGSVQSPWTGNAYGNSGGNGHDGSGSRHAGGGGGGAGATGGSGDSSNAGTGGAGRQNVYLDGTSDYYAGGGGGGGWDSSAAPGGAGGGGNGSRYNANGSNATGYGSGGGGCGGQSLSGGSGSAGIVVIRFQ